MKSAELNVIEDCALPFADHDIEFHPLAPPPHKALSLLLAPLFHASSMSSKSPAHSEKALDDRKDGVIDDTDDVRISDAVLLRKIDKK